MRFDITTYCNIDGSGGPLQMFMSLSKKYWNRETSLATAGDEKPLPRVATYVTIWMGEMGGLLDCV